MLETPASTPTGSTDRRAETAPRSPDHRQGVVAGVVLIVINSYLVYYIEPVRGTHGLSLAAPFFNVIFLLFVVTAGNAGLSRVAPGRALTTGDLLILYGMLSVHTALTSGRCIHWLLGTITYGYYYATPENGWISLYRLHLPSWLTVQDREVLRGYYLGNSTLFTPGHLEAWLLPVLAWTLFFIAVGTVFLAGGMLFSPPWIHRERLSYPVVELPFRMVSGTDPFWRQRAMWLGFALGAGIELINGLSLWFPAVPTVPTRRNNLLAPYLTDKPWSAVGELFLSFYPFVIGLGFLAPLDLSFSVLFFYALSVLQSILGSVEGWDQTPGFPFAREQQFGALLALLLMVLRGSRQYLKEVVRGLLLAPARGAWGTGSYRRLLATIGGGSVFLVAFLTAAGMAWWVAAIVVLAYLGMGLAVARIRAELGFPMHDMFNLNGPTMLTGIVGSEALGMRNIVPLALVNSFTLYSSNHSLPHQMEALKLADRAGVGELPPAEPAP